MSKVARSARVASRQRVETITASKTITQAESGEYYLINYDSGATITMTLPAAQDGAYFKFLFIAALTNDSAAVAFTAQAGEYLNGGPISVTGDGADGGAQVVGNGSSHVTLTIDGNTDVLANSWVEFVSDGSEWYISGLVMIVDSGTASNSIVFS